jgi:site-specific recombinase XerD
MAKVNFYLKDPQTDLSPKNQKLTLINMFFSYDGNRFKYSTGETIHPKYWNAEDQKVKKTYKGSTEINNLLESKEEAIKKIYREAQLTNKKISPEFLKNNLDKATATQISDKNGFFDYYEEFIKSQKPTKSFRTIQKYQTLLNHLTDFQNKKRLSIEFDKIDTKFYELLTAFFIDELKLMNNSIAKYIKTLKTFLHWATDRGYNINFSFKKFKAQERDADIIYITEEELYKLYELNLSDNLKLRGVRDTFCFGCFTGLRYSDIAKLRKENIKGEEIHMISEKTSDRLIIPLNEFALNILERNSFKLPVISNQKTNQYIKELGQHAELFDPVILTKFRGAQEIQDIKMKYEFLSTHTARRTFVTLSLQKGMRPEIVMKITGHKEWGTFKKYIKLSSQATLAEMKSTWNKPVLTLENS